MHSTRHQFIVILGCRKLSEVDSRGVVLGSKMTSIKFISVEGKKKKKTDFNHCSKTVCLSSVCRIQVYKECAEACTMFA